MEEDMAEGLAYPLTSKRIKLKYLKHLAKELGLPTEAPCGDLEVIMYGKLTDMNYDVGNLQMIITPSQEGETLSLKSVDGIVLAVSIPSEIPITEPGEINSESDSPSLNFEMRELKAVLQLLEEEMLILRTKLSDSEQEVIQLKQELSESRGRSIELWQENCKQLLDHDKTMMASERKVQQLEEQLQERELQLARHKLGRLTETIHSVDESKGDLSNLAMASGIYQPKADVCGTGRAVSSHLPEQGIDRNLVKEEAERKLPTAFIPSDSFVTKSITSHGQSQHVSVTTTTSTSPLTSNNPEKGMNNKQPILLTQPGPITSNVELSQPSTMPSYLYDRVPKVQWSQPLQHNFDSEPATSASADNPQVTCVSTPLSNVLSTSRHTYPDTTESAMLGDHSA